MRRATVTTGGWFSPETVDAAFDEDDDPEPGAGDSCEHAASRHATTRTAGVNMRRARFQALPLSNGSITTRQY
jgi:hypothetical protein